MVTFLYETSLQTWVMRPFISTPGLKEESMNELQVLKALPSFVENNYIVDANSFANGRVEDDMMLDSKPMRIDYVRNVGLTSSKNMELVGDSADGLVGIVSEDGDAFCAAAEIRTMISFRTINEAMKVQDKCCKLSVIEDIGRSADAAKLFQQLVPRTEYRL